MKLIQIRASREPHLARSGHGVRAESLALSPLETAIQGRLVDQFSRSIRYLRVSVTDRCNLRCTYCLPEDGVSHTRRGEELSIAAIVRVVRAFAQRGVERVRLTGGEPLVRPGLVELVERLATLRQPSGQPLEIAMTTNGELLAAHARELARAGLGEVTISLDSLDADRFAHITRRGSLSRVLGGIEAALAAGLVTKLNTVAVRGFNDDECGSLARWAWDRGITPRFIELMPMAAGQLFVPGELLSAREVRRLVEADLGLPPGALAPSSEDEPRPRGPAQYSRVPSGPYVDRRLGTIGAMTENFCASCNRVRLSAAGDLHGCLAHDQAMSLREALRRADDDQLHASLAKVLGSKALGHEFSADGRGGPIKAMISIGG